MIAYGNHVIEGGLPKLIQVLRTLCADIDADLGHGLYRQWMDRARLGPGAAYFEIAPSQMPQETFGHLRAR